MEDYSRMLKYPYGTEIENKVWEKQSEQSMMEQNTALYSGDGKEGLENMLNYMPKPRLKSWWEFKRLLFRIFFNYK